MRWSSRIRASLGALLVVVATGSLLAFAMRSPGYPARALDLNDSGIWVTSNSGIYGRLNKSASGLDGTLNPIGGAQDGYHIDVLQDGGTVLGLDSGGGRLLPIDVRAVKAFADAAIPMPPAAQVDLRGGTVAMLDPATGKVFAARYTPGTSLSLQQLTGKAKPVAQVTPAPPAGRQDAEADPRTGPPAALAVGVDGVVHVADSKGRRARIDPSGNGFAAPVYSTAAAGAGVLVSAVGDRPVVLDPSAGTLVVGDGKPVRVDAGAVLQQPGPDADTVLVQTRTALLGVPLDGGETRTLYPAQDGAPAAPVRVAGCIYAAWAGSPAQAVKGCGSAAPAPVTVDRSHSLQQPVFRVNRNQALLNDRADGRVFDVDRALSVDNWKDIEPPKQEQDQKQNRRQPSRSASKEKPKAGKDDLGARPERTTVLHVLDNDSDRSHRVLSIQSVTQPGNPAASVTVAPDGQSLIYALGAAGGDSDFRYQVSNGAAEATGEVHVTARKETENGAPFRRPGEQPALTVPSGGTLGVQVVPDWRDPDGDPVALQEVSVGTGTALMTSDGRIEYTAASTGRGGRVKVGYAVSDGRGSRGTKAALDLTVQPPDATRALPAVTEPDVAKGVVGHALRLSPLANDMPGSDPLNPKAALQLAGEVAGRPGLTVQSDPDSGQVSVVPTRPGTFFLSYGAGFGSAAPATGQIRVDARAAAGAAPAPVPMPDSAAVRGAGSVLVDVLANDLDPTGALLTVQGARAESPSQVQVAVVRGHWLRITPSSAQFSSNPQVVHYAVTNGLGPAVDGVVSVTQLPAVIPDSIVARPDYAVVRAGDAVQARVLDNDAALSGAGLTLLPDVPGAGAVGRLVVRDPAAGAGGPSEALGEAYVTGDTVRYVAPATATRPRTLLVEYVAQTEAGDRAVGSLQVTVQPAPSSTTPDRAPTPHPVDVRATAGETVNVPVPAGGQDPDGDSVFVVGISSAPKLGRVTGASATGLSYQAYPDAEGTDSFGYTVTDRFGQQATSLVRVAVVPPGAPMPAVAAPVSVTAAPGADVTVFPLTGAYYQSTDPVKLLPLDRTNKTVPEGVRLDPDGTAVNARAPESGGRPLQVSFALTGNAGAGVPSTLTVRSQEGFRNPPHIPDVSAVPDASGTTATADLLAKAYDPDGETAELKVTRIGEGATADGGKVTLPLAKGPRTVPFEVSDSSGAVSAGVIRVPAPGAGGPYVKPGAVIRVPEGRPTQVRLADYVVDPRGRPVSFTTTDTLVATPAGALSIAPQGKDRLQVTPAKGGSGPGALVVEVTDGATLDDPQGLRAVLSIPVQIGPETPVLRCPTDPVTVVAGGKTVDLDIASVCSVWTPTPDQAAALSYTASWLTKVDGLTASAQGRTVALSAAGASKPKATGTLKVGVAGTAALPATLPVQVVEAPRPVLAAITLQEMKQGDSRSIDLKDYVSSPLRDPAVTAVEVLQLSGDAAKTSLSGSVLTVTPGAAAHGRMTFRLVVSDVADPARDDRKVTGSFGFDVYGVPDVPARVQPGSSVLSGAASLSWAAPAANGAPIDGYEVSWSGGRKTCTASPCVIDKLTNGNPYSFRVRAHNKAGYSDPSTPSASYSPNEAPQQVSGLRQTGADNKTVTLAWTAAVNNGSDVLEYLVTGPHGTRTAGTRLSIDMPVPANGVMYGFNVVARNAFKAGPAAQVQAAAAGTPVAPAPAAAAVDPADADTTAVRVSWPAGQAEAPTAAGVRYALSRSLEGGGGTTTVCTDVTALFCDDTHVTFGTAYRYSLVMTTTYFDVLRASAATPATDPYKAVGKPAAWVSFSAKATGKDGEVELSYTVPASRGAESHLLVVVNGTAGDTGRTYPTAGGSSDTYTVTGLPNGVPQSLQVRLCNEGKQAGCSTSTAVSVKPYGQPTVSVPILNKLGPTTFQAGVTADGHGLPITVHVWTDLVPGGWTFSTTDTASPTFTYNVGYSQSDTAHVTITDQAGRKVPPQKDSGTVTADPPPVAVSISKGASVNRSDCNTAPCRYIVATTSNFTSGVHCTANSQDGNSGWFGWNQGANATVQSPNYFGFTGWWVSVTCTDGQGHSASQQITW